MSQNYDEMLSGFRLDVPDGFNFARDVFDRWAEDADRIALRIVNEGEPDAQWTFQELATHSTRICNVLSDLGFEKGDVLLAILPRAVEWWVLHLCALRMGLVLSPGTTQLRPKDIAFRLEASSARGIVAAGNIAQLIEDSSVASGCVRVCVEEGPVGWHDLRALAAATTEDWTTVESRNDDPALLYFTSGTTGSPKMTMHSCVSYPLAHRITGEYWLGLGPEDLHWNVSDTGWAKAAYSSLFGPWHMGATVFVDATPRITPDRILQLLSKHPITTLCGAPTIYRMLVQEDLDSYRFDSLRDCVAAGEPLNPEVIKIWRDATGLTIRDGYGQTETVILAACFPGIPVKPGSMGLSAPGVDLDVVDEQGERLAVHEEGDLAVLVEPQRPVGLFLEYWRDSARTEATRRGPWYITGDRAWKDEDGYLWFVGRDDDVILSAGYRIGPFEVESALLEHEAVAESAVVASPDPIRGVVVKAFVVLTPGIAASDQLVAELQKHVKELTAPYKYPRRIEFVKELPKTVSGKIRRVELRDRELRLRGRSD